MKVRPRALVQNPRQHQQRRRTGIHFEEPVPERNGLREFVPFVFAGLMLVTAFAFAGHYIGRNASAHNATIDEIQPLIRQLRLWQPKVHFCQKMNPSQLST